MHHKHDKRHQDAPPADAPAVAAEQNPQADGPGQTGAATAPATPSLQQERDDLLARLQRVSADYVNYQKRIQKDLAQSRDYANESLIKSLLVVLDDMDRGLQAARQHAAADDPLLKGMQLVHDKLVQVLGNFGLSAIESEGKPFDPELHQAVTMQATDKFPPQTVLAELQKGYQLKGRTIRPASVAVAVAQEKADDPEQNQE